MALSEAIRKRINNDVETKVSGGSKSAAAPSPSQRSTSLSSATLDRIRKDVSMKRLGREDPGVDDEFIKKFNHDYQMFLYKSQYDFKNMTYQNGKDGYNDTQRSETVKDLANRAAAIRTYLDINKDSIDPKSYESMTSFLDDFDASRSDIMYSFADAKNTFGKFDNEEDYLKAVREYDWQQKYQGKSYDDLLDIMDSLEDNDEKSWLAEFAPSVMTADDYRKSIAENESELQTLEKVLKEAKDIQNVIGMGGEEADSQLQRKLQGILGSYGSVSNLEARIEELKSSNWKLSNKAKYNFLDENEDYASKSQVTTDKPTAGFGIGIGTKWFGKGDPLYDYINELDGTRQDHVASSAMSGGTPYSIYDQMKPEEIADYNYLYNTEGKDAAREYLDYLEYALNERRMGDAQENAKKLANENPVFSSALSVPANLMGGIGALEVAGQNLVKGVKESVTGEYAGPVDYNRATMTPTVFSSSVRGTVAQNIADTTGVIQLDENEHPLLSKVLNGKSLADVYQLGMSMADSATVALMAPVVGTAGTYLLGGSAATQGMLDAVSNGATDEQALTMGIINGAFELLFEKYELEHLLGADSNVLKAIANQALTEGFGEGATSIANTVADILTMADKSEYRRNVAAYMEQGLSQEDAEKQAFLDIAVQVGWDFVGGMASGGIMGSIASPIESAQQRYAEAQRIYGDDPGSLVGEALEINPDNSFAQKMQGRLDSGKELSGRQLNRLVQQNEKALTAQDMSSIQSAAESRLTELGETGDVTAISAALAKQAAGKKLTKVEQQTISSSKYGQRVSNELNTDNIRSGEYASAWSENLNTQRINAEEYSRLVEAAQLPQETEKTTTPQIAANVPKVAQAFQTAPVEAPAATIRENQTVEAQPESQYEVSTEGKAELDGKDVVLNGFRKTQDGSVVVTTADNMTADPSEVKYPSKGHALVYESYANIETTAGNPVIANMDVDTRSMLAKAYDPADGVDAKAYFLGSNQAYWYGFEGISMNEKTLSAKSLIRSITEEQRAFAYDLGRKAGKQAAATQGAGIQAAYEKAVEKLGGKEAAAAIAKENKGKVVYEDGVRKSAMTNKQRASSALAEYVAEATSANIHVYHGMKEYGRYDPDTGEIWLNINGNFNGSSMMAFTLAHELVHMAKQWNPADFKAFADYLLEQYGKKGVSVETLIQKQMANAKRNGHTLDEHTAYEEVIAEACQRMLLDSDAVQKMAGYKEQNPSKWQQIVDAIKKFIDNIRKLFEGADPDSVEAALYKEFDDEAKQFLENKFVEMVMDAGEHMSTIRNAFGKGTVVEVNADGEFTLAKGEDSNGAKKFLYNDYTWEKGGRDTLKAALEAEGYSNDDIKAALTIMDGKHKLVKELAEQFPEQSRINQATITTDLKNGHSVLSALVSNGDYPVNIDLLMVCKKRKAYQRVINRLCETGLIQQATVDALAIAEINKILGKYGFETACLGCFVESRRLRIQEWANTIVKEWNAEVKKRNPDAKAFGFGKGEAKLTPDDVMQLIGELESGGEKNDQGNLNLGQGSAVKRMGVLLDKVPSLRKTLSVEDLITPDGLTALRKLDSNLFSMVKSRYGSNSPKFVQEFNPYNHELAMYGKVPSEYESLREYLYAIGGARMQSFSDFIVENWFDYCQIVADLAARKLPMHTYTKEITLAKLFGQTGIKINMSLIPDIDRSLGREFAGLTRNENGELELIWADKDRFKATGGKSYMQSINFADAIALQNDSRYSANVGTIAVGVSDKHILMMLDDARVRMIIPYHSSGMNPIFADLMGTSYYKDYTMFQNTTVKQLFDSKGQPVSLKLEKAQNDKLVSGFQFNAVLQELGDARAAAQAYKDWCADASKHTITIKGETYTAELTPKFDSFSWHDNYYKLLVDFNTYDCISEQAAPQGDVQQAYPEDFDKILEAELKSQEGHRQKQVANQALDKAMGEIETYLKGHTKADTVFYAEQHGVKLSAKDKKLGAEDKKKLADLRKNVRYSLPKITADMTDGERYAILKDATISVQRDDGSAAHVDKINSLAELGDKAKSKAEKIIIPLAEDLGILNKPMKAEDIDIEFIFSKNGGLHESLSKQLRYGGNYVDFAKTIINLDKVVNSAVLIEMHGDKYKGTSRENENLQAVYVLFSAFRDAANIIPVQMEIKKSSDIGGRLYLTVALTKIEASVLGRTPGENQTFSLIPASTTYNLADIFREINTKDGHFLKYLPDGFLSEAQKEAKQKAIEEDTVRISSYKLPNGEDTSPRSLLADAFDELVQTPKERELMDQYRNNIAKVEEVQKRLRKLRGEISRLTKAKGDKSKIAELNKTAAELADLIDRYDRNLLKLEASKPLRDVLARARSAAYQEAKQRSEETMMEYRQQVSERFDRGVEGRRKTEMRKKVRKVIRDLDKILNRGDKKRNVKEDMKDFVAEALSAAEVLFTDNYTNEDIIRNGFGVELSKEEAKYLEEARGLMDELANLPAGDYDAWQTRQEAEEKLKSKLAYRMTKLKDAFFRERQRLNKAEVAEVLGSLADAYAKLETSEYAYVNGAYHEAVYEYLKMLQEDVGGAKVKDMTLGQLEELYKAYTMVLTTVQNANKMFAEDLKQSKEELANRVMMEVYQAGGEHGLWSKGELSRNQASWNNTKPIYAAERTGSSTFVKLVNGLFKGQYNWATDMEAAKDFRQKVANKYGFKAWDMEKTYKFTSSSGIEFELNLNQIMSLYAYAKREQAHDHLLKGGFVFGKNTEVVVTKNGIKRTYLNKSAKAHNISDEIMGEIVGKLTKEQKGFVDEMQDYLSTTMGGKGNEVSMRLYGVKLFMEKFYFPLRSAGQFKEKAKEAELKQQQGQISLANSGFTKAVTPKASNPVVLDGFTDVWASHVNEMSLYHSMVLPMEDFRRVYNYASPNMEGQESASVNSFIENAYGDAATGYFDQLYKELNGGAIVDPRENLSKQMIGKFKKSAVMLSNSVVVQQFSAIGRAYAMIDPKHFIGPKVDNKKHAALWNELKQYAPVAIIKEMGGFDTHTGLGAKDYLLAEEYGKGERVKGLINDKQYRDEIMGLLPAKADKLTWCAIWEAVKRETKAKNSKMDAKSEEFLKKAGERFSEVIEKTQVYDSVLARSANMRSRNGLMQMLTAFMAEPTTTVNMVEDALRKGNKKTIARTFGAVAASIVLNNALASLIYAMRDDDEDETWIEKYAQAFSSGMLDDINPMTYYPILKDIWSLFQGYDIERSDMAIYSDIADSVKKVVTQIAKYDADMDEDDAAKYYKEVGSALMSLLDAGAAAFGVPLKNVRRDLMSYYNTYKTFARGDGTTWNSFVDAIGESALDSIPVVGLVAGESKQDKLYDAIVSGDTAYLERLKNDYKDQSAVNSAIRKALRENDPRIHEAAIAWNANDLDEYMRIAREIIAEKNFVQDDVVAAIRSEASALEPDEGTSSSGPSNAKSLFTEEKFAEAVSQGNTAMASAIKTDIIKTAMKNGKTKEDAEKSFVSSAKTALKEQFLAGNISEKDTVNALTTYCGSEQDDAMADVQYWAFKQDHPDIYADAQWFDTYYEKLAGSGLDIDVYMEYRNTVSAITGEDKKEKRMDVINALPITSAQKDALYLAEGLAESRIYEAPWH